MNSNQCVEAKLGQLAADLGAEFGKAVVIGIAGPILGDLDYKVRGAVESIGTIPTPKKAVVVLDTPGGVVELVQRMVTCLRHHFTEVHFVVPDRAMSAGTIFALSGDSIWMDYFSCLGPIDPQIEKNGVLIPALAYVEQFEDLVQVGQTRPLTQAELILVQKLDLADLDRYRQARQLSVTLLEEWLPQYKFKDWSVTETKGDPVTPEMKRSRANAIADALSNHRLWKSHGRPISMEELRRQLNLRIDDLKTRPKLANAVRLYFDLLVDYKARRGDPNIVHAEGWCE